MPSGSTRLTFTFLYSLPLIVLKSSASAGAADSDAKTASAVIQYFTRRDSACFSLRPARSFCSRVVSNTIQSDVISDFLHALRLTALCDKNKSMEFILALVLFLVVVVGIISIDHRLKRIVKILEERERRESDARRIRGLEAL